jgi:hypothetical protein
MEMTDPLPRLLRLRGAIEQSIEAPETITPFSMNGLKDSYIRLRPQVRDVATSLGVEPDEFDAIFPAQVESEDRNSISFAKAAAALLRQLDGYLDGLIEATAINEQVSIEQLKIAQEAARRPPGFAPS